MLLDWFQLMRWFVFCFGLGVLVEEGSLVVEFVLKLEWREGRKE